MPNCRYQNQLKARPAKDFAASRGGFLNGKVLAAYLGFEFIDAADVITFDTNGSLLLDIAVKKIRERIKTVECAVIPFLQIQGIGKTFSRGGSDVTGSIVSWFPDSLSSMDGTRAFEQLQETG